MAIGVYLSYKILDIADLTVDGSICTGACVCAVLLGRGVPLWLCVIAAFIAGAMADTVTGLLHTALGIPSILAGILTQLILYSVNLSILGSKSLVAIDPRANRLIMMHEGNIIVDVSGEEKKSLTAEQLLKLFTQASGGAVNDRMILN